MKGSRLVKVAPIASIMLLVSHALALALALRERQIREFVNVIVSLFLRSLIQPIRQPRRYGLRDNASRTLVRIDRFIVPLCQTPL